MGHYINTISIHKMTSVTYSAHIHSIKNHWQRLVNKRKAIKKAREAEYKPVSKPYSFRYTPKGTPVLTIRGRKPPYLYASEWKDLETTYPESRADLQKVLAKRSITVRPDKK